MGDRPLAAPRDHGGGTKRSQVEASGGGHSGNESDLSARKFQQQKQHARAQAEAEKRWLATREVYWFYTRTLSETKESVNDL